MKQRAASVLIFFVLVAVGTTASSQAPTPATLQGTWVYVSSSPAGRDDAQFAGRRIRMYTTDLWYVAQVDPLGKASFLYGGHYEFSGATLMESVDYASAAASSMLNAKTSFQLRFDKDKMTMSGRHGLVDPAVGAFDQVWQRHSASPGERAGTLTAEEFADVSLLQSILSATDQNLAASFLGNKNRLDMLALYANGSMGNANIVFGSEQVTASNAKQITARFQHRQDVYSEELRRRGTPKVEGRYAFAEAPPCPSSPADSVDVDLKQDGFLIKMLKAGSETEQLLPGVAVGRVLTMGEGDFDPDQYVFGTIESAKIVLRPFSGRGCGFLLTRKSSRPDSPRQLLSDDLMQLRRVVVSKKL